MLDYTININSTAHGLVFVEVFFCLRRAYSPSFDVNFPFLRGLETCFSIWGTK